MNLHPIITGSYVPSFIRGSVVSVHDHAVNLREGDAWRLISLVDRRHDLTARSLLIRTEELRTVVRNYGPGEAISIGVAAAESWSGKLPEAPLPADFAPRLCGQRRSIAQALAIHGRSGGLRDLVVDAGQSAPEDEKSDSDAGGDTVPHAPFLQQAARVLRATGPVPKVTASKACDLTGLVGLGVGLTPSGDDFITGALVADALLAPGRIVDATGLKQKLPGTTISGATLLSLALDASFPFYLVHFVTNLTKAIGEAGRIEDDGDSRGGSQDYPRAGRRSGSHAPTGRSSGADTSSPVAGVVSHAVAKAVQHGQTSGTDAVSGFLYALKRHCVGQDLDD